MSTRQMKLGSWFNACRKAALAKDDSFGDLTGSPVSTAAETLDLSRQRVHALVQADQLDAISVVAPNGTITLTVITENSLKRYLAARAPSFNTGHTTLAAHKA